MTGRPGGMTKTPIAVSATVVVCQNGVMDYSVHPMEPLAVRLTLAGPIDTINLPAMATELRRAIPDHRAPAQFMTGADFMLAPRSMAPGPKPAGAPSTPRPAQRSPPPTAVSYITLSL
jgi:hypothetical protein